MTGSERTPEPTAPPTIPKWEAYQAQAARIVELEARVRALTEKREPVAWLIHTAQGKRLSVSLAEDEAKEKAAHLNTIAPFAEHQPFRLVPLYESPPTAANALRKGYTVAADTPPERTP